MALTPEQLERIERNRQAAQERKRQRTSYGSSAPNEQLSQESTSSNGVVNPYAVPRTPRPASSPLSREEDNNRMEEEKKQREQQFLPPLPDDAPSIRDVTVSSLSEQQLEVVKLARPPTLTATSSQKTGYIARITAAAGAGKTTTLLHLAMRCLDLGHSNVTYVTFTRASAEDAKKRILDMLKLHGHDEGVGDQITASTLHSCAMKLVSLEDNVTVLDTDKGITSENGLENVIKTNFEREIEYYLEPALERIDSSTNDKKKVREMARGMREKVVFYLKKAFMSFCQSDLTLEQLKDADEWKRHYFPSK
jgi:CRISPR/Cas system-associated endonuclease/helicase Cas3